MKRSITLKIIVVTLLTLLLSGCNQMERFDRSVRSIDMEAHDYAIVSEYAISKGYKHQMIKEKVLAALTEAGIVYGERNRIMTIYLIDQKLYFLLYTGLGGDIENQVPEFVRGVLEIDTLDVTIYTVYYDNTKDISFKQIDDNHALISYPTKVELVQLNPYKVVNALVVSTNLLTYDNAYEVAKIEDQVLKVYRYSISGYETETFNIQTTESFHRLYGHYLLNTTKKLAYNIQTQTFVDYDSIVLEYPSNEMPLYEEIVDGSLTVLGKTWVIDDFMNQTDTLKAFKKQLTEYKRMFNLYTVFTQNGETYIALNYNGGGLLFLTDETHHYVFKLVNGIPLYVGSHPYRFRYVMKPVS